jgi:hypothetical protein
VGHLAFKRETRKALKDWFENSREELLERPRGR